MIAPKLLLPPPAVVVLGALLAASVVAGVFGSRKLSPSPSV
jgi:hypothetical protein